MGRDSCAKLAHHESLCRGRMFKPILFVALLAFVLGGESSAQWVPDSDEKWCKFSHDYVDGTELRFSIAKSLDIGNIVLWNNKWRSIVDNKEYAVRVETDTGYVGTFVASGMRTPRGFTGLFVPIRARKTVTAVAGSRYLELTIKGRTIGRYDLGGAAAAMVQALECANKAASEDPFSI